MSRLSSLLSNDHSEVERKANELRQSFNPSRVVLFGAGNIGRMVLGRLKAFGVHPRAFLDDTPSKLGTLIDGVPVLPCAARTPDDTVIVTILNPKHYFPNTARRFGSNVLPFLCLPWLFDDVELLHMTAPKNLRACRNRLFELDAALADDQSRDCLARQIQFRLLLDYSCLDRKPSPYFPSDVPLPLEHGMGYLDAGAFDGDTVRDFLDHVSHPGDVVAVEPDPTSFSKLAAWASTSRTPIRCVNAAVGGIHGVLRFNATGDMSASFSSTGALEVPVLTLREVWPDSRFSYLKFDIEGAEFDCLRSAADVIADRRPVLAVSVYHHVSDLWEIPLFLRGMGYKIWLRDHGVEGTDVVAYCIAQ